MKTYEAVFWSDRKERLEKAEGEHLYRLLKASPAFGGLTQDDRARQAQSLLADEGRDFDAAVHVAKMTFDVHCFRRLLRRPYGPPRNDRGLGEEEEWEGVRLAVELELGLETRAVMEVSRTKVYDLEPYIEAVEGEAQKARFRTIFETKSDGFGIASIPVPAELSLERVGESLKRTPFEILRAHLSNTPILLFAEGEAGDRNGGGFFRIRRYRQAIRLIGAEPFECGGTIYCGIIAYALCAS